MPLSIVTAKSPMSRLCLLLCLTSCRGISGYRIQPTILNRVSQRNFALDPLIHSPESNEIEESGSKEGIKPWFSSGLAFSCSMCGNCCSGSSGSVRFTDAEADEMAAQVKLNTEDFYSKYTRRRGRGNRAYFELKEVRTDSGAMDCVFLDRSKIPGKAICSLYGARPGQCRTWPFWPELLESEKAWKDAKLGPEGCPGLGKGAIVPYEEILRQRDQSWTV
jgi:uncharacterized protein